MDNITLFSLFYYLRVKFCYKFLSKCVNVGTVDGSVPKVGENRKAYPPGIIGLGLNF